MKNLQQFLTQLIPQLIPQLSAVLSLLIIATTCHATATTSYPAATTEITIHSQGKRMSGFIYHPQGAGPHPTVLLLHGYPGNEKNLDFAQAMRAKGWNVAFFHYRGAWGSEGEFSFSNAEQDVQAVLHYLSDPKNTTELRVNPTLISTVGHSMGGHMSIAGILDNAAVNCSVAWDGANLGANGVGFVNDPNTDIPWKSYGDTLFMLNGWSGAKAQQETKQFASELDLINRAKNINARPVLLIGANTTVIPQQLHIEPLYHALKATPNSQVSYQVIEDDHSFSASRAELINTTASFLTKHCK